MVTTLTRLCPGTGLNVSVDSTVELDNLMEETRDMSGLSSLAGLEDCIPSSRNLYAKKRYSSVVKIQDWHIPRQAEPKDNDPYHPAGGNYFLSTYHRLGTSALPTPNSETRDMLEQILCDKELSHHKAPMMDFLSCLIVEGADDSDKLDDLREGGIYPLPVDYGRTDYRTTMQYDYRPINPIPLKPLTLPAIPPMLNRKCISELNDGLSVRREGIHTFQDDGLEKFNTNREMRKEWYTSYNPAVGKYTNEK